jgi:hypothetical protein
MRDLYNLLQPLRALAPTLVQASTQGAAVQVQYADGVLFSIDVSAPGDTLSGSRYFEFRIQESADGSTGWADVANTNWVQYSPLVLNSGASATTLKLGYLGYSPYVRLSIVITGTHTNGTTISSTAILGFHRHGPAGPVAQVQVP